MKTKTLFIGISLAALAVFLVNLSLPVLAAPLAQFTPYPTPTPGADGRIIYIAQKGDSIWRIAAIFNIPLDQLYDLNKWAKDHVLSENEQVFLGLAGPLEVSPTPGPSPTPQPVTPTPTPKPGFGMLCILLYNDKNGDSMRQEEEKALPGGAISVAERLGTASQTSDTAAGGDNLCNVDERGIQIATSFLSFKDLPEGDYTISVAAPPGYNPTTEMNRAIKLKAGDITYMTFGAQVSASANVVVTPGMVVPAEPEGRDTRSPILGLAGALILLGGLGLGVYAALLRRPK